MAKRERVDSVELISEDSYNSAEEDTKKARHGYDSDDGFVVDDYETESSTSEDEEPAKNEFIYNKKEQLKDQVITAINSFQPVRKNKLFDIISNPITAQNVKLHIYKVKFKTHKQVCAWCTRHHKTFYYRYRKDNAWLYLGEFCGKRISLICEFWNAFNNDNIEKMEEYADHILHVSSATDKHFRSLVTH